MNPDNLYLCVSINSHKMSETTNPAVADAAKKERSASYPGITLEKAILFAELYYKHFSSTTFVKREEIASVLKMHPNSIAIELAACAQYGLMEKSTEGYKTTKLFDDIFRPENQKEKKISMLIAYGNPKLNKELLAKFDGHVIPSEFPNTLVKHHSITPNAAPKAAQVFIESGKSVGAINDANVLRHSDTLNGLRKMQYAEVEEVSSEESDNSSERNQQVQIFTPAQDNPLGNIGSSYNKVPLHVTASKVAYFAYPADLTANDIKIIKHHIDGILLRIELDAQEKTSG